MYPRNRLSRFEDQTEDYFCNDCGYGTTKRSNFDRHIRSSRHQSYNYDVAVDTIVHPESHVDVDVPGFVHVIVTPDTDNRESVDRDRFGHEHDTGLVEAKQMKFIQNSNQKLREMMMLSSRNMRHQQLLAVQVILNGSVRIKNTLSTVSAVQF